ncbi:MAG TPA: RNA polymerase sigma factor [Bacteroidales bacterium]
MTAFEFNSQIISLKDTFQYFAYSLTSNQEDANDLVQETFLKALKNKDKFDPSTNIKAWLYTIMRNTFINQYRRNAKMQRVFESKENQSTVVRIPDSNLQTADSQLTSAEIMVAIEELEDEFRIPFMMHFEGYKYKEIAEELNLSIGTVKSRIFFCRQKLMKKLHHLQN